MPPKGKEPPLVIPPLPQAYWKAHEVEELPLDLLNPSVVQFSNKPNAKFPGDYLVYCALLKIPPHPCITKKDDQPIEQQDSGVDLLELRNVLFDSRSLSLLMLSLRPLKTLQSLTFFNAGLAPASCKALGEGLPLTQIQHLRVDYNPLEEADEGTQIFLKSLTAPTSRLVTLSLRGNGLKDQALTLLCEQLGQNACLQSLNLFDNRISDAGGRRLVETMKNGGNNLQLASISLANNRLTRAGSDAWADLLSSGRGASLQVLNLSSNSIGFEGLQHFLNVLGGHKGSLLNLKSVALHRNMLDGAGGRGSGQQGALKNVDSAFWAPMLAQLEPIKCTI